MQHKTMIPRREFLKTAATGLAVAGTLAGCTGSKTAGPVVVVQPDNAPKPVLQSRRIRVGCIGVGDLGRRHHLAYDLMNLNEVEVVAVCDVDANHRDDAVRIVYEETGKRVAAHNDFRDLVDRKDIDAVLIATPDHWHALPAIAAMESGKDVYCEKPLTLTIEEGKAMVAAARRYGRVFQTGSQQRSDPTQRFRQACEIVRNGMIGQLKRIDTVLHGVDDGKWLPVQTPPPELDWNFWLGQAPYVAYRPNQVHYRFRWFFDYSGGVMTDWGAHHNDIAQWGNGSDGSGPVWVDGRQSTFSQTGPHTVAQRFDVHYKYANGVDLWCHSGAQKYDDGTTFGNGVKFTGSGGWVFVSRSEIQASDPELLKFQPGSGPIKLYESLDHHKNWVECIQTRKRCICDVEIGHRSVSICHIGNISMRLGRSLKWDPDKEEFVGDAEANAMLSRPMRAPWHL